MDEQNNKGKLKYKKYLDMAKTYLNNKTKSNELLDEATTKSNTNKNALEEVWDNLQSLIAMFRSWVKGDYKEIPTKTILSIIAAIIYFVSPVDFIPDFIVGLGFADDAAIIGFTIKQITEELEKFKIWQAKQEKTIDIE
jgi:uncharacterized membrane protein YkvA (DUF1232 family)